MEVQIKIWKLSLEDPRVIEIGATNEKWVWKGRVVDRVDFWLQIQITTKSTQTTLIGHDNIAGDKALQPMGKFLREAQRYILLEAWDTHDGFFRRWCSYPDKKTSPQTWKMPRIKFMIEDESQARNTRQHQRLQKELAVTRRANAVP